MNQDFFEMLISFIISQNKQIPHIKKWSTSGTTWRNGARI